MVERLDDKSTINVKTKIGDKTKNVSVNQKKNIKEDILGSHYSIHLCEIIEHLEELIDKQNAK